MPAYLPCLVLYWYLQHLIESVNYFDYPLLADPSGSAARAYGVKRKVDFLRTKRATFVINQDQTIRDIIQSELSMTTHADKALESLRS